MGTGGAKLGFNGSCACVPESTWETPLTSVVTCTVLVQVWFSPDSELWGISCRILLTFVLPGCGAGVGLPDKIEDALFL